MKILSVVQIQQVNIQIIFLRGLQGPRQDVKDRQIMNNQSHTSMNIDDHYLDNLHHKLNIYSI